MLTLALLIKQRRDTVLRRGWYKNIKHLTIWPQNAYRGQNQAISLIQQIQNSHFKGFGVGGKIRLKSKRKISW